MRTRISLLLSFLFTLSLLGCANKSIWIKSNITDAEAQRDGAECKGKGKTVTWLAVPITVIGGPILTGVGAGLASKNVQNSCFRSKGYHLVPKSEFEDYKKRLNEADSFWQKGEYTKAIEELHKASQWLPDESTLYSRLGWLYEAKSEYEQAIKHFLKSNSIKENCFNYRGLGRSYLARAKDDMAKLYYEKAFQLCPDNPEISLEYGLYYLTKKEYRKALEHTEMAEVNKKPTLIKWAYQNKVYSYLGLNRIDEAISEIQRAIEKYPDSRKDFEKYLAMCLVQKRDFSTAKKLLGDSGWIGVSLLKNRIIAVNKNTPAYFSGFRNGDIIKEFGGINVSNTKVEELVNLIQKNSGKEVNVGIEREGEYLVKKVTPGITDQLEKMAKLHYEESSVPTKPDVTSKGWIGISIRTLEPDEKEKLKVMSSEGVVVTKVEKESPADKGGLKPGDLIVEVENTKIFKVEDLLNIVSNAQPGKRLKIEFVREGEGRITRVTLEEKPL